MLAVRDLVQNQRILKIISVILKEGDKMCQRCYEALSNVLDDSLDLQAMNIAFEDEMEKIDSSCREETILAKQSAKE
ncbi:unnamed protein product [Rotaria magnacalcarata]|uniref:Uncharacterized protein n=2 Tax=Rotaria magnacalcarata TaxID=392030 RepID=A0A814FFN9_9BILA|nr:unnamed protein product [Rotaria magnacalcarata]CAF4600488.1 unnamed protein product [Rotaria magnacalcarata]CAF5223908.1 unnamed protein product [Rotaria magnacalcarata]